MNIIKEKVEGLPEIYQPIFGFPSLSKGISRKSEDRLKIILQVAQKLKNRKNELKILDLGCAQGFFSFSLAQELGATVVGIDIRPANIELCNEIKNHFSFEKVKFFCGRLEEFLPTILNEKFDLVLGLSVFHHLIAEKGLATVEQIFNQISKKASVALFELALKEEALHWAETLPEDYNKLLTSFNFRIKLATFPTHLTEIKRPLVFASNYYIFGGGSSM